MVITKGRLMSDFSLIPIEEIQWTDVCSLLGEPETPTLEFKRDLRVPKGGQHPWHLGQDLDRHARDSIASEVVGFANAWGGTLVLGADEDKSTPRRCSEILPLPRAALLASKLEASLASIIDPPLANLVCRAVLDPTSQDSGVVLISVSRSVLAPHGYGGAACGVRQEGLSHGSDDDARSAKFVLGRSHARGSYRSRPRQSLEILVGLR